MSWIIKFTITFKLRRKKKLPIKWWHTALSSFRIPVYLYHDINIYFRFIWRLFNPLLLLCLFKKKKWTNKLFLKLCSELNSDILLTGSSVVFYNLSAKPGWSWTNFFAIQNPPLGHPEHLQRSIFRACTWIKAGLWRWFCSIVDQAYL